MKKIEVKVRYLFEGTYTVAADDRNEARTMVTRDCGLVLGGNIHTTLDDDEVDWEFDVHPDMQILSYTEKENEDRDTPQGYYRCHKAVALLARIDRNNLSRRAA